MDIEPVRDAPQPPPEPQGNDQSPEEQILGDLNRRIIEEDQFIQFRNDRGFTSGHHGTFWTDDKSVYLYVKPNLQVKDEREATNSLRAVAYLTEKGILFPETRWGTYRTRNGDYQLFAVTRKLTACSVYDEEFEQQQAAPGRQKLLRDKWGVHGYSLIYESNSHILEWARRINSNLDPDSITYESGLVRLLSFAEASHTDNWAWAESGRLYPVDIEVLNIAREESQKAISEWIG